MQRELIEVAEQIAKAPAQGDTVPPNKVCAFLYVYYTLCSTEKFSENRPNEFDMLYL